LPRTLLLDLDGTLVDSVPDLQAALNRLLATRRLAPLSRAEVASMVGDGVAPLVERAFAARGATADSVAVAAFLADYGAHAASATRPYPAVERTLRGMAADGWRFAVCTNKPEAVARALLSALGLADLFAAIGGGDSFPTRKPDPAHLLATLRAADGRPDRAVAVGDHANDVLAANGAGLPCIFAGWGYGQVSAAAHAAAIANGFGEVRPIADRLLPA
jgi:phosphoglycolate phosphatase